MCCYRLKKERRKTECLYTHNCIPTNYVKFADDTAVVISRGMRQRRGGASHLVVKWVGAGVYAGNEVRTGEQGDAKAKQRVYDDMSAKLNSEQRQLKVGETESWRWFVETTGKMLMRHPMKLWESQVKASSSISWWERVPQMQYLCCWWTSTEKVRGNCMVSL